MAENQFELRKSVYSILSSTEKAIARVEELADEGSKIFPSDFDILKKQYNQVHYKQVPLYYELCSIISNLDSSLARIKIINSELSASKEFISPQTRQKLATTIEVVTSAKQSAQDLKAGFDARLRFLNSISYDPTMKQYL